MKKALVRTIISLLVLFVLVCVGVGLFGGSMIKAGVNAAAPAILGVPVKLENVEFRPFRGVLDLHGLHVGNPEGFKTAGLFDLKDIRVELVPSSLLSDTIHIRKIMIADPEITYELAMGKSNIGKVLDQLGGEKPEVKAGEAQPAEKKSKKVLIDELVIDGTRVRMSAAIVKNDATATISLPPIRLHDIGKEKGGASFAEASKVILAAIAKSVTDTAGGADALLKSAGAALDKSVGKGTSDAIKSLGNLFKGKGK